MITKLTDQQKARFPFYIDKWTRIGLSTEPLDRGKVDEALQLAFRIVGKNPPRAVVCRSPLSLWLTIAVLRASASVRASVLASVSASVIASVLASVLDSVLASVRASVSDSVIASVRASVLASVIDSVLASVRASVRASVSDSVRDSVSDSVSWYYDFGQFNAYWLAF